MQVSLYHQSGFREDNDCLKLQGGVLRYAFEQRTFKTGKLNSIITEMSRAFYSASVHGRLKAAKTILSIIEEKQKHKDTVLNVEY